MRSPCSVLKITGKRKFQSSQSQTLATAAVGTHIAVTFLNRLEARNLIQKCRFTQEPSSGSSPVFS